MISCGIYPRSDWATTLYRVISWKLLHSNVVCIDETTYFQETTIYDNEIMLLQRTKWATDDTISRKNALFTSVSIVYHQSDGTIKPEFKISSHSNTSNHFAIMRNFVISNKSWQICHRCIETKTKSAVILWAI